MAIATTATAAPSAARAVGAALDVAAAEIANFG